MPRAYSCSCRQAGKLQMCVSVSSNRGSFKLSSISTYNEAPEESVLCKNCISEEQQDRTGNEPIQALCQQLARNRSENVPHFLERIQELKEDQLSLLNSSKDDWPQKEQGLHGSEAAGVTDASELLQLFREHHIERVVQIESVYNRISTCEQEKENLYSKLRYRAQKRDQEKRPPIKHQELEETKASLQGLTTALEFIQAEQENLVERVMSLDEQHSKLEAMNKASRMTGQQLDQLKLTIAKLIEMTKLNCTNVPVTALSASDEIMLSLSQGIAQLSALVQDQVSTVERDAMALRDLTQTSQRHYTDNHVQKLQAPTPNSFEGETLLSEPNTAGQWHKVATTSSFSLDRHILQLARMQQQEVTRNFIVAQAKDLNEYMRQTKDRIVSIVKSSAVEVLQSADTERKRSARIIGEGGEGEGEKRAIDESTDIDSLDSKFEADVKNASQIINNIDQMRHIDLQHDIQDTLTNAESGSGTIGAIRGLAHDRVRIAKATTLHTKRGGTLTALGKDGKRPWFGPQ
ncbi:hypothetical protein EC968_007223 [Mortierella alpina]|nr:hypothetical protein EC968_007223 [Mortierella alpina]